jgi:hypothetical protein
MDSKIIGRLIVPTRLTLALLATLTDVIRLIIPTYTAFPCLMVLNVIHLGALLHKITNAQLVGYEAKGWPFRREIMLPFRVSAGA